MVVVAADEEKLASRGVTGHAYEESDVVSTETVSNVMFLALRLKFFMYGSPKLNSFYISLRFCYRKGERGLTCWPFRQAVAASEVGGGDEGLPGLTVVTSVF